MEDVLDLYAAPPDPKRPLVCLDEKSVQLLMELRPPQPLRPGQPQRIDYTYKRNGTRNLFIFLAPGTGWRHVKVTAQRTKLDFAQCLKELVDVHFPDTEVIRLVVDNLNTHTPAVLYEAFEPTEARRILSRLEFHYTPKHGSWLNMAEIEIAMLSKQCLDRRLPDEEPLRQEVTAWQEWRNAQRATVQWQFTTADARTKLKHLYPTQLMW